jgi:hypothetical protein
MLAVDSRSTAISTASLPLTRESVSRSAASRRTCATSDSRIDCPPAVPMTTRRDLIHIGEFVDRPNDVLGVPFLKNPTRKIDVLSLKSPGYLSKGDPELGEPTFIDLHENLFLQTTRDPNGRNTLNPFKCATDLLLGQPPECNQLKPVVRHPRVQRAIRDEGKADHGFRSWIITSQSRTSRRGGKIDQVETLPDIERRKVHVRSPPELNGEIRTTRTRAGRHLLHPLHHRDRLLNRARNEALDLARPYPPVLRLDRNRREGQIGKKINLKPPKRYEAENQHGDVRHGNGNRASDRKIDDLHAPPPDTG